ncbi:hypothetical protein RhiirA5_347422 [Rhizophagus irregularis]|uniref:Uncharacterized protein n=3 Tax=Rhizophagus irregularis TaxID=588596 RepID=A0A2I1G811_9GLOM|nr:hypothetical protein GLOIN_2v1696459 [Rhizophagus irregularis DAOM 181602=DAOM 197198]EXX69827.1 hypothetical protein RirG_092970 [Rhizophagus irregularis DAOM 197198w]PKC16649.1 hypothetical protein RhiirA5_347422 [Rhizophagus irregularis]PKC72816.1 hypothetical protein RhiirA1_411321 [Rhizophagus irregularis]PKK67140.1 hypothetical protein RhiirC2_752236 [Rhizophagus irregularis]PKY14324.1 hypothetical protein RhiirB3_400138 [Rhizophagus irregularis]|eukprot:XP_025169283.1 hypothetical protein GLOIN_2v1696459 [Rhizophagus irregularis DAOM 181602=DAOM 197198]
MNCFWNSRLSLLNSRTVKRKLFVRSYATESGSHQFPKEGFGAPIWRRTLGVVIFGLIWYQADQYFTKKGEKHPVTKWIETLMIPESEYKRRNLAHLYLSVEAAKDKVLFGEAKPPPIYRLKDPDQFERASPHCIEPGLEVDLTDLVVRKD